MSKSLTVQFMDLLRIPQEDAAKMELRLQSRLIGLGHGATCGRCGGCGSYSFNPKDGTKCFGCGGSGYVAQKLTAELLRVVAIDVEQGKLDAYLAEQQRKLSLKRIVEGVEQRTRNALLENNGLAYDWQLAAANIQPHRDLGDLQKRLNAEIASITDAKAKISSLGFTMQRAKTAAERGEISAKIEAEQQALADLAPRVIENGKAILAEIPDVLDRWDGVPGVTIDVENKRVIYGDREVALTTITNEQNCHGDCCRLVGALNEEWQARKNASHPDKGRNRTPGC